MKLALVLQYEIGKKGEYMEDNKTQPVCWKTAGATTDIPREELKTAVAEYLKTKHPIDVKDLDVTGDGLPDRFILLETPKNYLVVLYQGGIYTHSAGKFDEKTVTNFGHSSKGELVGAIAKAVGNAGGENRLQKLDWNVDVDGEKPIINIWARGVSAEFSDYLWKFERDSSCTKEPLSYDPTLLAEKTFGGEGHGGFCGVRN